ncbi:unnamed protein product [Brassica oleracea var. botrytis]
MIINHHMDVRVDVYLCITICYVNAGYKEGYRSTDSRSPRLMFMLMDPSPSL